MKLTIESEWFDKMAELGDADCAIIIRAISGALHEKEEIDLKNKPLLRNFADTILAKIKVSVSRSQSGKSGMKSRWGDNKTITKPYQTDNKPITKPYQNNNKNDFVIGLLSKNEYQNDNKIVNGLQSETSENSGEGAGPKPKDKKEKVPPHTPLYRERTENLPLKEKVKREKISLFSEQAAALGLDLPQRFYDSYGQFIEHRLAGKNKPTPLSIKQNARDVKKCLDAGASVEFVCGLLDTAVANAWTGWFFREETLKKIEAAKNSEKTKNPPAGGLEVPQGYAGYAF